MVDDSILADLGGRNPRWRNAGGRPLAGERPTDGGAAHQLSKTIDGYRIDPGPVRLADHDPGDTGPFTGDDRELSRALLRAHDHTAWLAGR